MTALFAGIYQPVVAHEPSSYFENTVHDAAPTHLFPDPDFQEFKTDDTHRRIQAALNAASAEDEDEDEDEDSAIRRPEDILYREDMRDFESNRPARHWINE
ncbi:hypothetical protein [Erythrobacter sp. F6033]|uniref:hypothetical protein n=1 Tax=Erythrobacter sp. F6033 TaxID=2926401 RepID=UPI001FF4906A|nr:hypothetical protein [Erythrobacter sp. F6033]MCK0129294.1 hypothetical protein [Erythrobacter sp. F6033]